MIPESQILADVLVAVSRLPNAMVWRNNSGLLHTASGARVRASIPGAPDVLGVIQGRAIGIETKTERGRQSTQQKRFQAAFERAGGLYIVARSVQDVLAVFAAEFPGQADFAGHLNFAGCLNPGQTNPGQSNG